MRGCKNNHLYENGFIFSKIFISDKSHFASKSYKMVSGGKNVKCQKCETVYGAYSNINFYSYFNETQKFIFRKNSCFLLRSYEDKKHFPSS